MFLPSEARGVVDGCTERLLGGEARDDLRVLASSLAVDISAVMTVADARGMVHLGEVLRGPLPLLNQLSAF